MGETSVSGKSALRLALKLVLALLRTLPHDLALTLAEWLALLVGASVGKWSAVARQNLAIAYPAMDQNATTELLRSMFKNLGRVLLTIARAEKLSKEELPRWIEFKDLDNFKEAKERGKGVLFLTAHLGNWELSALAHAIEVGPMNVMVRPIEDPWIDQIVERSRAATGNRVIPKANSARAVLQALRDNEAVGVLADQNTVLSEAVFVDFFGTPAAANKGFVQLAMRSGAAVVPGFACWNDRESRHVLRYYPALEMVSTGNDEADVIENTWRCQAAVERAIRRHPEQWLWIHRRWKTRPPGEKPIYDDA